MLPSLQASNQKNSDMDKPLVLVVDDDIFSRRVLIAHLNTQNLRIMEAENGILALEALDIAIPDIILMDAVMPEMDGYEACREIRKRRDTEDIPILMITMMDDEDSIADGFKAGASDYIPKPYNWALLSHRMRHLIEHKQAREERKKMEFQLYQAHKMEAIGRFTGGIAHDFNNILAGMMGFTELAQEAIRTQKYHKLEKYLSNIHATGKRAQDLIAIMLAFCRKGTESDQQVSFANELQTIASMLRPILPSTIKLDIHIAENVPPLRINPVQMQQVVMNLCLNSRDAMVDGGLIKIHIQHLRDINSSCVSCHQDVKGDFIEISLEDTGTGMDSSEMTHVFDPYFTTKAVGEGSGMGLSVVHGIVHECGGHILMESSPGLGTRFHLLFLHADITAAEQAVKKTVSIDIDVTVHAEKHVLVIDDEPMVSGFMTEYLSGKGFRVTEKNNSEEALAAFIDHPQDFDLIITDQTMPGLTGLELAQKILALDGDMPIILCTGYSAATNEKSAKEIGIKGFLSKPMESSNLLQLVNKLLTVHAD